MSVKFQFSNRQIRRSPLFFHKYRGGSNIQLSLKPISEAIDQGENHPDTKNQLKIEVIEQEHDEKQQKCCAKYLNCVKRFWRFFFVPSQKWKYDLNNKDFECLVDKIKTKSHKFRPLLPPQKIAKKVLVLDLDQTLVYTTFTRPERYDFELQVRVSPIKFTMQSRNVKSYSIKRFGLDVFLYQMSKLYEIILFTACNKEYTCKAVQKIDPNGFISHKLFRQAGITVNGNIFLKNIIALGRDLQHVVVVDDNRFAGMLQPDNFYQIQTFKGHQKDKKLIHLANFLRFAHKRQKLTPVKTLRASFESLEIDIEPDCLQFSELEETRCSGVSSSMRRHLQKKISIQPQSISNEFENEGQTTVTNLIKNL